MERPPERPAYAEVQGQLARGFIIVLEIKLPVLHALAIVAPAALRYPAHDAGGFIVRLDAAQKEVAHPIAGIDASRTDNAGVAESERPLGLVAAVVRIGMKILEEEPHLQV